MKKADRFIGKLPKNSFQENLEKTISWYLENADWWN